MKRLEYLDGLRGLAICGVLLIHIGQSIDGLGAPLANFAAYGFRGVHLFFIVSALTLMTVSRDRLFDARSFYIRRFFRIAPMFYLAIAFYTCLYGLGPHPGAPEGISILDILLTALFDHFGFLSNGSAFACGIALFYLLEKPRPAWFGSTMATVGIVASLGVMTLIGLTGMGALRQALVAIILLSALTFFTASSNSKLLNNPVMAFLGKVSFSIYLVHFAVLHFGAGVIQALPGPPTVQFVAAYLLVLGVSAAISTVTYNLIELPMIARGRVLSTRPTVLQPV